MKDLAGPLTLIVVWLSIVVGFVSGWVMNILNLLGIETLTYTVQEVLMIVGVVFFPLGALMGWLV